MKLIRVGVDLVKSVFQVHGVERSERTTWRWRLRREEWMDVLREWLEPGGEVGMEACGGAHHWARELLHLRRALPLWLEDEANGLTARFRRLLRGLHDELILLEQRIAELNREIEEIAKSEPAAKRLMQLRGVGPIIATAMLATVGDARQFNNGRQVSASIGLTPKQHSPGGKERMLGISKRGDAYLRSLLIHGARAVIRTARAKEDPLSKWVIRIADRRHANVAAAALANKTTRIAWAMLSRGTNYQPALN